MTAISDVLAVNSQDELRQAQITALNRDYGPVGWHVWQSAEGRIYGSTTTRSRGRKWSSGQTIDAATPQEMRRQLAARHPASPDQRAVALADLADLASVLRLPLPDRLFVAFPWEDTQVISDVRERLTRAGVPFTDIRDATRDGVEIDGGAAVLRIIRIRPGGNQTGDQS